MLKIVAWLERARGVAKPRFTVTGPWPGLVARAIGLGAALLFALPAAMAADCQSSCQRDYWACTQGFGERDCATTRSICQMRCTLESHGAIGYSDNTGVWGWSSEQPTRTAAERVALQFCRDQASGADDCRILIWFRLACGALARDPDGPYGADWGNTSREAARKAIAVCEGFGGQNCEIETSVCSR